MRHACEDVGLALNLRIMQWAKSRINEGLYYPNPLMLLTLNASKYEVSCIPYHMLLMLCFTRERLKPRTPHVRHADWVVTEHEESLLFELQKKARCWNMVWPQWTWCRCWVPVVRQSRKQTEDHDLIPFLSSGLRSRQMREVRGARHIMSYSSH